MLAQQLVHSQDFTFEEKRFQRKQNQVKLLLDQANFCRERCLLGFPQALKLQDLQRAAALPPQDQQGPPPRPAVGEPL